MSLLPLVCAILCTLYPNVLPKEKVVSLRPPAVPLITHDPYFSIWSTQDHLTQDWTRHWTGAVNAMGGMLHIDGHSYRFLAPQPSFVPAMEQKGLAVLPTRTIYTFQAVGIQLTLTFMTPLLPDDLEAVSRPITYITATVQAIDGKPHKVSLYFDISGESVVNSTDQAVQWGRYRLDDLDAVRMGTQQQPVLEKAGDNLRIDWGHLYLVAHRKEGSHLVIASDQLTRVAFGRTGKVLNTDDLRMPRPANDGWPLLVHTQELGTITEKPIAHTFMLAYDDGFSIEYFYRKLRPYWRRNGAEIDEALQVAAKQQSAIEARCIKFDAELMQDLRKIGGEQYAQIGALAYRQCLAAHKLVVDADGTLLLFSKENFSNGCIGTVDVTYPSAPFFLLFNPKLLRAMITPILNYASSERWRFPFAPHDLGTYPKANGQVYGGGERTEEDQMPVEECGNMLILVAALAKAEGSAEYAHTHWKTLTTWAKYLKEKGLDPDNQLCTDDFAGHLAHNTNLSLKAIMALGGYAQLCALQGLTKEAQEYHQVALDMAHKWVSMAEEGDHYRLAFDRPNTWSQKYNLVWDKLLGMNLFPAEIARKEIAYYKTKQNRYGLPLDNRKEYTKLDWIVWTATMTESRADFEAFIEPVHRFLNETPSRVAMSDWYWTQDAKQVGFQARSVVGGVFIPFLAHPELWKRWLPSQNR